jgi:hypothetical protein
MNRIHGLHCAGLLVEDARVAAKEHKTAKSRTFVKLKWPIFRRKMKGESGSRSFGPYRHGRKQATLGIGECDP